jgi:hypothetical protein
MEVIYTESQIRKAWAAAFGGPHIPTFPSWSAEALVRKLKENDHVHDFTDTDTVTVKELLENAPKAGIVNIRGLLQLISEHREPEYEPGVVVKDAKARIWLRCPGRTWLLPGSAVTYPDSSPKRPLFRMTEMP